jgi:hypothetical protein
MANYATKAFSSAAQQASAIRQLDAASWLIAGFSANLYAGLALILFVLVGAGCASVQHPAAKVTKEEVSAPSLDVVCDGWRPGLVWTKKNTSGCYKMSGASCTIYVLPLEYWIQQNKACMYQATIEHEIRDRKSVV